MKLDVEWYVINDWGGVSGPFKSKSAAIEDVESSYRGSHGCSREEFFKDYTIVPQIVKTPEAI